MRGPAVNEAAKLLKARARAEALDLSPWTDIEFSAAGVSADGERYIRVPLDIATVLRAELIRLIDARLAELGVEP